MYHQLKIHAFTCNRRTVRCSHLKLHNCITKKIIRLSFFFPNIQIRSNTLYFKNMRWIVIQICVREITILAYTGIKKSELRCQVPEGCLSVSICTLIFMHTQFTCIVHEKSGSNIACSDLIQCLSILTKSLMQNLYLMSNKSWVSLMKKRASDLKNSG